MGLSDYSSTEAQTTLETDARNIPHLIYSRSICRHSEPDVSMGVHHVHRLSMINGVQFRELGLRPGVRWACQGPHIVGAVLIPVRQLNALLPF